MPADDDDFVLVVVDPTENADAAEGTGDTSILVNKSREDDVCIV